MRIKKEYYVYLSDQNKESFDDIKKNYILRDATLMLVAS